MTILHVIVYPPAEIFAKWKKYSSTWYDYFPSHIADEIFRAWKGGLDPYSVEMLTRVLKDYEGPLG